MFVLDGYVASNGCDIPTRILLDSGASHQYVSLRFANENSLPKTTRDGQLQWVQVANGSFLQVGAETQLTLAMGDYQTEVNARILDVEGYDIILGMDWLRSANPTIDWKEMTIRVTDRAGRPCTLQPASPYRKVRTEEIPIPFDEVEPMSACAAIKMLRIPTSIGYLLMVKESYDSRRPDVHQPKIQRLVTEFEDVFREELPMERPPPRDMEHTIDTGEATPINLNSYPLSPIHQAEQSRQISIMLTQGIIRESASPWGFPVLFVKKPGGKWRMCIDYRALNAVTRKNGYPLPRITECIDRVGHATILSKIDLTQGYYQIPVKDSDQEKTAFNTIEGKFEFVNMPFGLANAPATFQTLMNRIFRPFITARFVIVYLDDILVFSMTLEDHLSHLRQVFRALRDNKLYGKPSKTILGARELEFCGHMIGNGRLRPLAPKVAVINDWPIPKNVHEVRQFLGMATYYRRFIRDFARIGVPLFDLLKEGDAEVRKKRYREVHWTAACQQAFLLLKRALTIGPVLAQPQPVLPFVIETDASEWAIGCVLKQKGGDNKLHPVAYDGRKLSSAEINYAVHEKELLAVKYALQIWRIYIDNGHTTKIYTDHESLKYLATMKKPTKRLARWIEEFGEYDIDLQYRRGELQVVPDAISRRPDLMGEGPRDIAADKPETVMLISPFTEDDWAEHLVALIETGIEPPKELREELYNRKEDFLVKDGTLHHVKGSIASPYIGTAFRADFLDRLHSDYGHLGFPGILGIVTGRGWWQSLEKDAKKFISYCPSCQISQRSRPNLEREEPRTLNNEHLQIFDRWAIDLIGILPTTPSGNRWIVTAIEYLTGWPIAKALPDAKAETIAEFLHEEIAMVYGAPKELLSDNGGNLTGHVMTHYLGRLRTKHRVTTPYHPRTNGKVENFNGFLGATLTRLMVNRPTVLWDQYLSQALFAIRVRIHTTTKYSPYYLLFGRHPNLPDDDNNMRPIGITEDSWHELLVRVKKMLHARTFANRALVHKAISAMKAKRDIVDVEPFSNGDWVLVRAENRNKFEGRWFGPYQVRAAMPLGTYRLADPYGNILTTLINGCRLIPARIQGEEIKHLWNSSRIQNSLRKRNVTLEESSPIVTALFEKEHDSTPRYRDLEAITEKEWQQLELEKGDKSDPFPSREDIQQLEEGIDEGLAAERNDPEDTTNRVFQENRAVSPSIDRPVSPLTPAYSPLTEPFAEEIAPRLEELEPLDTPVEDMQTNVHTIPMDLDMIPESEQPSAVATPLPRTSQWAKQADAGFGKRDRSQGHYTLRPKLQRTQR